MADDSASTPLDTRMTETMSAAFKSASDTSDVATETSPDTQAMDAAAEKVGAPKVGDRPIDKIQTRDATGKFVKAATDATKADDKAKVDPAKAVDPLKPEAKDQPVPTTFKAPSSWKAPLQEKFSKLEPDVQQQILEREENFHKGLTQYAEGKRNYDGVLRVVQPYQAMLQSEGITLQNVLQESLGMAYQLRHGSPQTKQQIIRSLAQSAGIDLGTPDGETQDTTDPAVRDLQRQVGELTTALQNREQQVHVATFNKAQQEVQSFETAKDESGNLKYPHFAEVRQQMAMLTDAGEVESLDQAYETAIYMVPSVRQKVLAEQQAKAERDRQAEEQKRAEEARRAAGVNIRSAPIVDPSAAAGSVEDTMRATYRRISAG